MTVRGTVSAGAEAGCLLLSTSTAQYLLLSADPAIAVVGAEIEAQCAERGRRGIEHLRHFDVDAIVGEVERFERAIASIGVHPGRRDHELATQLWELVMAGEIGSAEYRRLDAEINRRKAMSTPRREPVRAGSPWR